MSIDVNLIFPQSAVATKYKKNEMVFREGEAAHFYYQIIDGGVRIYNSNIKGREFTQGHFCTGDGFDESPLLIDEAYPCTTVTILDSDILKLSKKDFLKILEDYPSIQKYFLLLLAKTIHSKSKTSNAIINQNPEFRITAFLNSFKKTSGSTDDDKVLIPYTRQEIANYTGLRVETVIRAFTKMKDCKKVEIINHKIYY